MKTLSEKILLCAVATLFAFTAVAKPPHHREPRSNNDLKEASHGVFTDNAPEGFKDAVPHFAIFGKKGMFYLGIGGAVKATAGIDWGAPTDNPNELITADIFPVTAGNETKFNLSAMQSNLFVNFVAFPNSDNQLGAFIGMNFLNNYCPVLQYAYIKYRGIEAGYDYSVFSDNGAMPPTIDYEGPNACTASPVPVVNYTYTFGKKKEWSVAAGLELPSPSITTTAHTASVNQAVPDIPVAVKYTWGDGGNWVKGSAIMRNIYYHNDRSGKNVDVVGWGVSLSGTTEIIHGLRGYWTGVYGHGVASLMQDCGGLGMDLSPVGDTNYLTAAKTWGAFGGLQYNFTDDIYCSASYSHIRNYAKAWSGGSNPYPEQYKWAQYAVGNLFWNVTPIISTGIEYIYGRRVNVDGSQAHDNRLQAMLQVAF